MPNRPKRTEKKKKTNHPEWYLQRRGGFSGGGGSKMCVCASTYENSGNKKRSKGVHHRELLWVDGLSGNGAKLRGRQGMGGVRRNFLVGGTRCGEG